MSDTHTEHGTIWLCDDCTMWEVNRDDSGTDPEQWDEQRFDNGWQGLADDFGLRAHHMHLSMSEADTYDIDGEPLDEQGTIDFATHTPCDICRTHLAGRRTRFVVWG